VAAVAAKMEVPKFMKDSALVQFGRVEGMSGDVACVFVNGK
jgi:hypothetical protein